MSTDISIHNLAVLRAAVEGAHLGTYFGSWAGLQHWIGSTASLGLVDADGKPTPAGAAMATALDLSAQGSGRAYMWPKATQLEAEASALPIH